MSSPQIVFTYPLHRAKLQVLLNLCCLTKHIVKPQKKILDFENELKRSVKLLKQQSGQFHGVAKQTH